MKYFFLTLFIILLILSGITTYLQYDKRLSLLDASGWLCCCLCHVILVYNEIKILKNK